MTSAAVWLRIVAAAALAFLILIGATSAASAHAQLVASVPGAGQRLDSSPSQLTLIFSERLDPLGSGIDLLDSTGKLVASGGAVDVNNPRSMSLTVPQLADGLYSVNWRTLSADDGHSTTGFFNFGVGDVAVPGVGAQSGGGVHAGHGLVQSILETVGRILSELGVMLSVGLAVVLALVVIPTSPETASWLRSWAGWALIAGGVGAIAVLVTAASSAGIDPVAYAESSGASQLLVARTVLGLVAGSITLWLATRNQRLMLVVGGLSGLAAAVLLSSSGHAAGFDSLAPIAVSVVHVVSAGAWLSGLAVMSALAVSRRNEFRSIVRPMIPRFSAVALVSAALFVVSGIYLWWLVNRTVIDLSTDYSTLLVIKALLVIAALMIGATNFLGWRRDGRIGPLTRIPVEMSLALAAVAVTALVASGSPPGPTSPTPILREASSAAGSINADLAIVPAQPGPNQIVVTLPDGVPTGETVTLILDRLDQVSESHLSPAPVAGSGPGATFTTDAVLPANSQWDASVVLSDGSSEIGRARFGFSFAADGSLMGASRPPVDPLLVLALIFGALSVVGLTIAIAGGWLPRADHLASRRALLLGSGAALTAAVLCLVAGPRL
ncbi:MAG TPA: copper resistance CopC family protein [Candidatus Limnocylindrales bacterium]|jgi:copper transport protein